MEEASTRRSGWACLRHQLGTEADRRNQFRFLGWLALWMVTFVAAAQWLRSDTPPAGPAAWAIASGPMILGVVTVIAYLHYLRQTDELIRRIQLEGLAIGFAAAVLFLVGYPLFEDAGAPTVSLGDSVLVLAVGWSFGQLYATWRYR